MWRIGLQRLRGEEMRLVASAENDQFHLLGIVEESGVFYEIKPPFNSDIGKPKELAEYKMIDELEAANYVLRGEMYIREQNFTTLQEAIKMMFHYCDEYQFKHERRMLPDLYLIQNSCQNCVHSVGFAMPDDPVQFYCGRNRFPPPRTPWDTLNLGGFETLTKEESRLEMPPLTPREIANVSWEQWCDGFYCDRNGICPHWERENGSEEGL